MKYLLLAIVAGLSFAFINKPAKPFNAVLSPLSEYSTEWDKPEYQVCNTAANANYMSGEEKKLICMLNMARMNPKLFCKTVVKKYPALSGSPQMVNSSYYKSLVKMLNSTKAMGPLQPDEKCYNSAQCHAYTSGTKGYTGHDRQTDSCLDKRSFNGECCDYGHDKAIQILMSLLVDEGVASLGHRSICFSSYKVMAVSIEPHSIWGQNAVLDFRY
jgi:uncharacterized protein YkwD